MDSELNTLSETSKGMVMVIKDGFEYISYRKETITYWRFIFILLWKDKLKVKSKIVLSFKYH